MKNRRKLIHSKHFRFGILLLLISAITSSTLSQSHQTDNVFDLDLNQLMQISVASKRIERLEDAPGIVAVITAEEIKQFGGRNLRDVLNRATSFQSVASNYAPQMSVFLRGQSTFQFDNHILYLINGKPFRDSLNGGSNSPLLQGFPIDIIERIEFIRGPGSVLYGSNAFAGVINIVTKTARDLQPLSLSGSYGSFNTKVGNATIAAYGDDWESLVAFTHLDSKGWRFRYSQPSGGGTINGYFDRDNETMGVFAMAHRNNLTLSAFYGEDEIANFNSASASGKSNSDFKRWIINSEYILKINDIWQGETNITHNGLRTLQGTDNNSTNDLHAEFTLRGKISDKLNTTFGGVLEWHNGLLNDIGFHTQWYSAYNQIDYQLSDCVKLIGGMQWNKPTGVKQNFSPRLSAIVNLDQYWGLKIGYGEAFRAPFGAENFFQNAFISANPDLKPEIIETAEAQIFYRTLDTYFGLSYFYSEISDIITFVPSTGPAFFEWVNLGEITSQGVELEGKTRLTDGLSLSGSVSWQTNKNQNGVDDVTFTPNWMAKLGVSYDVGKGFSMGLFDSYFGNPTSVQDVNPAASGLNPKPDPYHLLTFNMNLHIPTLLRKNTLPDATLTIYGDNLLDEEINFPDFNSKSTRSIPQHSGRAFYLVLKINI